MPQIQISTLHKITQLLSTIRDLKEEIDTAELTLEEHTKGLARDLSAFEQSETEKRLLQLIFQRDAKTLDSQRQAENKLRLRLNKLIDAAIAQHFNHKVLEELIEKISIREKALDPVIVADPKIAEKYKIAKFTPADSPNQLYLQCGHKKYILTPELLFPKIHSHLLIEIIQTCLSGSSTTSKRK